jgi:hypothetical protein
MEGLAGLAQQLTAGDDSHEREARIDVVALGGI